MNLVRFHSTRGFTLIEVLLSVGLASLILGSASLCFQSATKARKLSIQRADAIQAGRVAVERIAQDLRSAIPLTEDQPFVGLSRMVGNRNADNIDFATLHHVPKMPGESAWCETSYFLAPPSTGDTNSLSLWRRRDPTADPEPYEGGIREEIIPKVHSLRFEYFDGLDWYTSWGEASDPENPQPVDPTVTFNWGMPRAVRILLQVELDPRTGTDVENPEPPMTFRTVACLDLADRKWDQETENGTDPSGNPEAGQNPGEVSR